MFFFEDDDAALSTRKANSEEGNCEDEDVVDAGTKEEPSLAPFSSVVFVFGVVLCAADAAFFFCLLFFFAAIAVAGGRRRRCRARFFVVAVGHRAAC